MGSALAGSNPVADENIFAKNCSCMKNEVVLPEVGFEPTLANETELKSAALDHSAIQAVLPGLQVLPGLEPGLLDSKSKVITNYTIGPDGNQSRIHLKMWQNEMSIHLTAAPMTSPR